MRIVLATPLYPPDIAEPAPYIKELAARLRAHEVCVVTYGRIPERVEDVRIVAINKRLWLPVRLFLYTLALWRALRSADICYAQNGPSVELPVAVVTTFLDVPLYVRFGDRGAHIYARSHTLRGALESYATRHARVVTSTVTPKPEILPFAPYPQEVLDAWDISWETHIHELERQFHA